MQKAAYKNARQVEFCQLLDEMEQLGFKQADVSRLIAISRASVSRIYLGQQTPRESTLDLFRRIVSEKRETKVSEPMELREEASGGFVDDLVAQIAGLKEQLTAIERTVARIKASEEKAHQAALRTVKLAAEQAKASRQ
jgi:predicted transcriptional regulator